MIPSGRSIRIPSRRGRSAHTGTVVPTSGAAMTVGVFLTVLSPRQTPPVAECCPIDR